jgi:uncharacterized protein YdaU (DUF1376 family)
MEIFMHYYQFNIGDYIKATSHLTPDEDITYRRMLDMYYDTETPIPDDVKIVAKKIRMNPDVVESILKEFFTHTSDGWTNARADREITAYHGKIKQASNAGKASAERRFNARSTDVQLNSKQETVNINHLLSIKEDIQERVPSVKPNILNTNSIILNDTHYDKLNSLTKLKPAAECDTPTSKYAATLKTKEIAGEPLTIDEMKYWRESK